VATDKEDDKSKSDSQSALSLGELRKMITDTVASAVAGLKGTESDARDKAGATTDKALGSKSDAADSIEAQVRAEIQRMKDKEAASQRDKDIDSAIADLKKRTEEKPPVERRRVHKLMGWGD